MRRQAQACANENEVKFYDSKLNTQYIEFAPWVLMLSACMPFGLVWLASKWNGGII